MEVEKRIHKTGAAEVRDLGEKGIGIEGYAAVWFKEGDEGTEYKIGRYRERIVKGAFSRAIKERQDVRALYNHDPNQILGRSSAETLELSEDDRGLRYQITAPRTTIAEDLARNIGAGNIQGSSFAFRARKEEWIEDDENEIYTRLVKDVDLFDVGPVTFPAFEGTSTSVRSKSEKELSESLWIYKVKYRFSQLASRMKVNE